MTETLLAWIPEPPISCLALSNSLKGPYAERTVQTNWQEEFTQTGATQVRLLNQAIYNSEAKANCAREWLREQERAAGLRDQRIYSYTQRTFWVAVAAVIVAAVGILVNVLH